MPRWSLNILHETRIRQLSGQFKDVRGKSQEIGISHIAKLFCVLAGANQLGNNVTNSMYSKYSSKYFQEVD